MDWPPSDGSGSGTPVSWLIPPLIDESPRRHALLAAVLGCPGSRREMLCPIVPRPRDPVPRAPGIQYCAAPALNHARRPGAAEATPLPWNQRGTWPAMMPALRT